jgi:hypothetical protein
MGLDHDMRIETADGGRRALHLGLADLGRAVDHLALQVRQRDRVIVDHPERADAGRGQIEQRRGTQPARADHQHARTLEGLLPRPADLAQDDVAGVAFELLGAEHCWSLVLVRCYLRHIGICDGLAIGGQVYVILHRRSRDQVGRLGASSYTSSHHACASPVNLGCGDFLQRNELEGSGR